MHIKGNTKNAYPFTKVFLTLSYYDHLVEMIFIWQLTIPRYLIIKALPILYEMHASLFSHSYHIKCRRNLIFTPRIKWFHSDAKIRSILRFIYSHKEYYEINLISTRPCLDVCISRKSGRAGNILFITGCCIFCTFPSISIKMMPLKTWCYTPPHP